MKKLLSFFSLAFLLSGCSFLSKDSEIEYNNKIVELVNQSSSAFESSATLYNESIPDIVTEVTEIDTSEMQISYDEALIASTALDELLSLESRNLEQQNAVRPTLTTYRSAGINYLESYLEMLEYYSTGAYKTDITQVKALDETLHSDYTTFIQANNDLVEVLESFVSTDAELE